MRKTILVLGILAGIALLSLMAASQLTMPAPIVKTQSTFTYISPTIDLEEAETCTTSFFEETQPVYGTCTFYDNYTSCLNTTGPNTACGEQHSTHDYRCQKGAISATKNKTECAPNKEFVLDMKNGTKTLLKKNIDFSDWGPCIREKKNGCLIVTCVSYYDGAHNGEFVDCRGGKTCQRFEICGDGIKITYKNSREDFAEDDPTFYYKRLNIEEVGP